MTLTDACALLAGVWVGWRTWPRPPTRRPERPAPTAGTTPRRVAPGATAARRRRDTTSAESLARWCVEVARLVRSGESLATAADTVEAPDEPRLVEAIAALRRGESPDVDAPADRDVALVLGVLAGVHAHGGAAAEPLDRAATVLRSRAELLAEAATQSAQARWSAQIMTVLPGAMLVILLVTSSSVRAAVVHPVGLAVVGTGAVLNLIGWWWLRALLARPTA